MNNFGCVLAVKCHCCYFVRLPTTVPCLLHCSVLLVIIVSAYRYIATTTLAIRAVFLEYLRQFLIDLHQTYRHSSVPKTTSTCIFWSFLAQAVSEHGTATTFFCHYVCVTV